MKYSYKQFKEWTNLSLNDKINWSEQVILNALKNSKVSSVSCSWGKDSIVMLHLIRKFCKNNYVMFADTGVEYPETYEYRDLMLKLWDMNYVETKPIKSFWQCVKEYGYPMIRATHAQDKRKAMLGKRKDRSPKCCHFCKEKPLSIKQKELGVDTVFIGLQSTESMHRRLLFLRMGGYYKQKATGLNVCLPLVIWTNKDIWDYIKRFDIPMNKIYEKLERNGCMPCTGFINWEEKMAKTNFALYRKVQHDKGQRLINDCFTSSLSSVKEGGKE